MYQKRRPPWLGTYKCAPYTKYFRGCVMDTSMIFLHAKHDICIPRNMAVLGRLLFPLRSQGEPSSARFWCVFGLHVVITTLYPRMLGWTHIGRFLVDWYLHVDPCLPWGTVQNPSDESEYTSVMVCDNPWLGGFWHASPTLVEEVHGRRP